MEGVSLRGSREIAVISLLPTQLALYFRPMNQQAGR
jgi:hypothetical protein